LIFNFETLHAVLGEMIVGGIVVETGLEKVVKGVKEQGKVLQRGESAKGRGPLTARGMFGAWSGRVVG
jgi:AP-3 complex subunit sigma